MDPQEGKRSYCCLQFPFSCIKKHSLFWKQSYLQIIALGEPFFVTVQKFYVNKQTDPSSFNCYSTLTCHETCECYSAKPISPHVQSARRLSGGDYLPEKL